MKLMDFYRFSFEPPLYGIFVTGRDMSRDARGDNYIINVKWWRLKFESQIFTFSPFTSRWQCQSFNCARVLLMLWMPEDSYVLCLWFKTTILYCFSVSCLFNAVFYCKYKKYLQLILKGSAIEWTACGFREGEKNLDKNMHETKEKQWKGIDEQTECSSKK